MLSRKIIETEDFCDLTPKAQSLYVHLVLNADDEGFFNNARLVLGSVGYDEEVLDELIQTGYVLPILPRIYAITHWHIHNCVPKDRAKSTIILDWRRFLELKDGKYMPKGNIR